MPTHNCSARRRAPHPRYAPEIEESINPFDKNLEKNILVNIDTGKGASPETTDLLLNVLEKGQSKKESFIKEVNERPSRFEDAITRNKLLIFASEGVKLKTKNNNKISEVRMERNLYDSLLCIALVESIDISLVLIYPITPVPLSMCHIDGTMAPTSKHELVAPLEKRICSLQPEHGDCHVRYILSENNKDFSQLLWTTIRDHFKESMCTKIISDRPVIRQLHIPFNQRFRKKSAWCRSLNYLSNSQYSAGVSERYERSSKIFEFYEILD